MAKVKKAQFGTMARQKSTPKKQVSIYKSDDKNYRTRTVKKPVFDVPSDMPMGKYKSTTRRTVKGILSGAPRLKKQTMNLKEEAGQAMPNITKAPKITEEMKKGGKLAKQLGRMKTTIGNVRFAKSKKK